MRISIALTVLFILSFYAFGVFNTINFDFSKVYELRRDVSASLPPIYGYLIPIFAKSIIPIGTVVAIAKKKYILVITFCILSIILFGLTTHKGILFYPIISSLIYIALARFRADKTILIGMVCIFAVSSIDFALYLGGSSDAWTGSLLTRRALLLPALHHYYFIEYFSEHPWYWWSQSKFTFGLIEMPYKNTAPFEIGLEYYNNPNTSANTGWIGSGYSNAGMFGVFLYAMLTGLLFSVVETISRKFSAPFAIGIFVTPVVDIFTSADLTTLLLTHGLLVSIILLMVMKRSRGA